MSLIQESLTLLMLGLKVQANSLPFCIQTSRNALPPFAEGRPLSGEAREDQYQPSRVSIICPVALVFVSYEYDQF